MIDRHALPVLARVLEWPARRLAARGVPAVAVTLVGFGFGVLAAALIAYSAFIAGLLAFTINRTCDGLDGLVARRQGPTDRGAFLDIAADFLVYAAIPFGFALADPGQNALPAAALLLAFMGTASSFLAFAVIAGKRGLESTAYPTKGIYYLGGLTEGGETFLCFVIMCIWPALFPVFAWVFAGLCTVTTATRWIAGMRMFNA